MPAIAADGKIGADFDRSFGRIGLHAGDRIGRADQVGHLGIHHDLENRKLLAAHAQVIEKIPLRHEGDEGVFYLEPAEIGDPDRGLAELAVHFLQLLGPATARRRPWDENHLAAARRE